MKKQAACLGLLIGGLAIAGDFSFKTFDDPNEGTASGQGTTPIVRSHGGLHDRCRDGILSDVLSQNPDVRGPRLNGHQVARTVIAGKPHTRESNVRTKVDHKVK